MEGPRPDLHYDKSLMHVVGSFSRYGRCPAFIGRATERDELSWLIDSARNGHAHVALVSGEAGIGKSRLAAEARAYAGAEGFVLLLDGQCFETDKAFPYAPLLSLFRAYLAHLASNPRVDSVIAANHSFAAALAQHLPDLVLLFPQFAASPAAPPDDPEEWRRQLFAVMTHFVAEQAARQPVLLVLEDIHWCDDLSLSFLLHLVRRCRQVPLLLLATYRNDEPSPRLTQWLAELDRERLARELRLQPLLRNEIAAMLQATLGESALGQRAGEGISSGLLDTLCALSEGNPFFIEELLKSLMTSGALVLAEGLWKYTGHGASVPRSIEASVQQRMAYLSEDAKRLVALAAVAGRRFDVTLLREVMQCSESQLLVTLKELMAAQLVVEEAADHFAFRHALTQQAVSAGLLVRERETLHRSIAETLERLSMLPPMRERYLGDLAYHSYEVGMWEQALDYSQELGEKALALYAQQAAIAHLTRALEAAHHLSRPVPDRLYLLRGQAYEAVGDFEHALGDYQQALQLARTARDTEMEWQSLSAIGFLWTGRDYGRAGTWFRQALALAEEITDPPLRARSLNRLGNWLVNMGQVQEGLGAHEEALHLFEAQQNLQGVAETLEQLGVARYFTGDPASAVLDYFPQTIELFRTLGDRRALFSNLAGRAMDSAPETIESTFSALRTRDECLRDVEEALRLAREVNSQSGQAFVEMAATHVLASFGEFGPALDHAQEALSIAQAIEHQEWIAATHGAMGQLYLLLLQPDRAIFYLEAGVAEARAANSAIWAKTQIPYLALAYTLRHEFSRAEETLEIAIPRDRQPGDFFERQAARAWGELALARGEPTVALQIADGLIISAAGAYCPQPIPHLLALRGQALLALKRLEEAAAALEEARLGAQQRQAPSILWRIHNSLGHVYRLLKRDDAATQEWAAAREIIARLAAAISDTATRKRFKRAALASLPEATSRSHAGARNAYGGLSAREREVAALLARGSTNREIASRLVVSERTAESHVSSILIKLGFSTRTQIAAWAIENGLTTTH